MVFSTILRIIIWCSKMSRSSREPTFYIIESTLIANPVDLLKKSPNPFPAKAFWLYPC